MNRILLVIILAFVAFTSSGQMFYIVRHAEKATQNANMSSDVELSDQGKERAEALMKVMVDKKIGYVFSTNTIRTKSTAKPTADHFDLITESYDPRPDSVFIDLLKAKDKNTLIVGHSNTVDDIVNMLCGKTAVPADLPETEYDNLFIVEKLGNRYSFKRIKYGKSADPIKDND